MLASALNKGWGQGSGWGSRAANWLKAEKRPRQKPCPVPGPRPQPALQVGVAGSKAQRSTDPGIPGDTDSSFLTGSEKTEGNFSTDMSKMAPFQRGKPKPELGFCFRVLGWGEPKL